MKGDMVSVMFIIFKSLIDDLNAGIKLTLKLNVFDVREFEVYQELQDLQEWMDLTG